MGYFLDNTTLEHIKVLTSITFSHKTREYNVLLFFQKLSTQVKK